MSSLLSSLLGNKTQVKNLGSEDFESLMKQDENAVLLDVRTQMEHGQARIPNSALIDIASPTFQSEIDKLDKSKSYYVYCRSGNRSYHAARTMMQMGFENVYNLAPGIIGWHGETESDF